jgi:hypothetical protein
MFYNIVKCFVDDSTTRLCPSDVCIAQHDQEENVYVQACFNGDEAFGFSLQLTTIADTDENETDRFTYFWCGYNECNKKSVLAQIRTIAEENYDLKPMLTALHMLGESEKTTTKASSSLSSAAISMAVSSKSTNTSTMAGTTKTTAMQSNIATTHVIGSASFVFGTFLLLSLF